MLTEAAKVEVNKILDINFFLDKKDDIYVYELYGDRYSEFSVEEIKEILSKKTTAERYEVVYKLLYDRYFLTICDAIIEIESTIKDKLNECGIVFDDSDVRDYLYEVIDFEYPTYYYLNKEICANLILDVGDANYDFGVNDVRYLDDYHIPDESVLIWVAEKEGYTKEQLESAIFKGEYIGSKFLESLTVECENAYYMNAFTFLIKTSLRRLIDIDKKNTRSIVIDKNTTCGLIDYWYGAGGPMDIVLEKDIEVPVECIDSFTIDGGRGTYSIHSIYAPSENVWNGDFRVIGS